MRTVLLGEPPAPLRTWLDRRRALGQDRFDEVWEGDYHVAPEVHGRHSDVQNQFGFYHRMGVEEVLIVDPPSPGRRVVRARRRGL